MNLKTILVPLDGSTVAEAALAPAVALARRPAPNSCWYGPPKSAPCRWVIRSRIRSR